MRRIFFALSLVFFFTGCSVDDEPTPKLVYELVPIISTNLPEEFTSGETYDLRFTYSLPSSCHNYKGSTVEELDGGIGIGVIAYYNANKDCNEMTRTVDTGIQFVAGKEEFYIFKFWQGQNEQGENQFFTVQIPVMSNSS